MFRADFASETGNEPPTPGGLRTRLTLHGVPTWHMAGGTPSRIERKQAALLAYVHGSGSTPRGRLAGLLWPDATASGARSNLRQCLARLRRSAPHALIETDDAIGLAPGVVVDTPADSPAELLDAYEYGDCDEFARWLAGRVDTERATRRRDRNAAFRSAIGRGDFARAQAEADALLAADRESEDAYRALMEVAYLRGDFAAALRAWERCREMLRTAYGVAPSSTVEALGAAVLAAASPSAPPRRLGQARAVDAASGVGAGNLGRSPPTLFGRSADLAALLALLQAHRLVTLIGIGGIGKTSLALAAAHAEREQWSGGVWFVDLAPASGPAQVAGAIAHALGLNPPERGDPVEALAVALQASRALLVLDNAEHVWESVAALASGLVAGTDHLRLLVTSRRALRVPQEQRFRLSGLPAPTDPDLADAPRLGALALFEARAAALDPRFRLTPANLPAIIEMCRRLDGLPLAIELAAARVPVLGLEGLRARLERSLRVIGAKATGGVPRHETLQATFDWAHDLLRPGEQRLLRRLAVFVGGFSLPLAEEVACEGRAEAAVLLDDLSALIDNSLVVVGDGDPPRYRLHEVTRTYAWEKLVEAGEADRVSEWHARAIEGLFVRTEAELNEKIDGALSRGQFLRRLTPELDNLRAARAWSRAAPGRQAIGIGLAGSSVEMLRLLGLSAEALGGMLELRDRVDATVTPRSAEMFWTGLCALGTHGRLPSAEMIEVIGKAEDLYRRIGSARRIHVGLYRKGFALMHLGSAPEARAVVADMASLETPDWPARAVALRLNLQGAVEGALGCFDASISAFREAAARLHFEPDERDVVMNVLANLCMSLLGAERHEEALAVAGEVLGGQPSPVVRIIAQRATMVALTFLGRLDEAAAVARLAMPGWRSDDMLPHMLSVFAWLAYLQGRVADAVRLDGAARTKVARMGLANSPVFDRARKHLERALAARDGHGDEIARWRAEGNHLREDDLVALCIGDVERTAGPGTSLRR